MRVRRLRHQSSGVAELTCTLCGRTLPITQFVKDKKMATGRRNTCAHCYKLRQLYSITYAEYQALLNNQGGVCSICNRPQSVVAWEYLCVDHDHTTGKVRGLLCNTCNAGIAQFGEDIRLLEAAIVYLRRHKEELSPASAG